MASFDIPGTIVPSGVSFFTFSLLLFGEDAGGVDCKLIEVGVAN